ncbi:MAG: 5-formyltetrahydrofolate cyclo-ligase [Tepidisphaeraceae bacterium]
MTEPLHGNSAPDTQQGKRALRATFRATLAGLTDDERHRKSVAATALLSSTPEFRNARVVMLFLSTPGEVDTTSIALRCWQEGKTVVVPKVSWDQRRMMPIEINSLSNDSVATVHHGPARVAIREPIAGKPMPLGLIDLVLVPGLGFSVAGHRIGRGMGFYDRFLAQRDFLGTPCGLAFEEQIVESIPCETNDVGVGMLVTDRAVRRFAGICIPK